MDVLTNVKSIIDTDWLSANSDSITPIVALITDAKVIDLINNDYILLYEVSENISPFGLGGTKWGHDRVVSVDIRTTYKRAAISAIRAHLIKMKDEVYRICKAKVANPDSDHQLMLILRRRDLSDKSIGLGRMCIDVNLKNWGS